MFGLWSSESRSAFLFLFDYKLFQVVVQQNINLFEEIEFKHTCCLESGFRNSGFTMSKRGGSVLAVRSTLSLEVPLSNNGNLLVSPEYISYVVDMSNEKMKENWTRTEKLLSLLKIAFNQKKMVLEKDKSLSKRKNLSSNIKEVKCDENDDVLDTYCNSFENMTTCYKAAS